MAFEVSFHTRVEVLKEGTFKYGLRDFLSKLRKHPTKAELSVAVPWAVIFMAVGLMQSSSIAPATRRSHSFRVLADLFNGLKADTIDWLLECTIFDIGDIPALEKFAQQADPMFEAFTKEFGRGEYPSVVNHAYKVKRDFLDEMARFWRKKGKRDRPWDEMHYLMVLDRLSILAPRNSPQSTRIH